MKKRTELDALNEIIILLEHKQDRELQLLKDELAKAAQFGFTQRELDDAKKSLSAALDMQTLDIADLGEKLLHYQVIGRTLNYDIQLRKKIESLTLEELNAAFKKHIDPQKFAYFSAGNFK